jgi:hypothetical protein
MRPLTRIKSWPTALLVTCAVVGLAVWVLYFTTPRNSISVAASQAYIGQTKTVHGMVWSASYEPSVRGKPTYLDMDAAYPNARMTVVIWGERRSQFGEPERDYIHREIYVTGQIASYRGKSEIVVASPSQIQIR